MSRPVYYNTLNAKNLLATNAPVIVWDLETTGISEQKDRIIQCSAITYEWNGTEYVQASTFEQYIKPLFPVPAKIEELTGITNAFLESYPEEKEAFRAIYEYFCRKAIFAGYNSTNFDNKMMNGMTMRQIGKHWAPKCEIDVFRIAKELIVADDLKDKSYKLCNVADYYKVTEEGFHNASIDIINTWRVLVAEMKDFELREPLLTVDVEDLPDLSVSSMSRWKKAYGKDKRFDRIYTQTNRGEYVVDLINSTVKPKTDGVPEVDPTLLLEHMNMLAREYGYRDYFAVQGNIKKRKKDENRERIPVG